jgi:hypothetical protein
MLHCAPFYSKVMKRDWLMYVMKVLHFKNNQSNGPSCVVFFYHKSLRCVSLCLQFLLLHARHFQNKICSFWCYNCANNLCEYYTSAA